MRRVKSRRWIGRGHCCRCARYSCAANPRLHPAWHDLAVCGAGCRERARSIGQCHRRHRHQELLKFLAATRRAVAARRVMCTSSWTTTARTKCRRSCAGSPATRGITCISRPTSASWLNQVERFFSQRRISTASHRIRSLPPSRPGTRPDHLARWATETRTPFSILPCRASSSGDASQQWGSRRSQRPPRAPPSNGAPCGVRPRKFPPRNRASCTSPS